jgi:type VI secretion system protein ImpJ
MGNVLMDNTSKVVWHEGLFLEPQHFQQQERYFEALVHHRDRIKNSNYWGFTNLELDTELLPIGSFNIKSAKGIFPDGTVFNITNAKSLPTAIEIPEGLNNAIVYLAIPNKYIFAEVGSQDEKNRSKNYRYHTKQIEVSNAIDNCNQTSEIDVAVLACQLLVEPPNLNDYAYLPIARITESRKNFQITLDKMFMPTWLDVHSTPALSHYITEVHNLLNHRAEMLSARLTDTEQAQTAEFIDYMILQLVNKYEPLFHYLCDAKPLHPEKLFQILVQLMGEMATFTNNKRRPIQPPVYQHNNLFSTFKPVIKEIRNALSMVLEQNAISITLTDRGRGLWFGEIADKNLINEASFILAVYAEMPLDNLRSLIPNQLKISPFEVIENLVSRALPGVQIENLAVAPRQIPYQSSFCYFTINSNHELWKRLDKSAGLAMHLGANIPGIKFELWAIKG